MTYTDPYIGLAPRIRIRSEVKKMMRIKIADRQYWFLNVQFEKYFVS
jgi:hypothetical protein